MKNLVESLYKLGFIGENLKLFNKKTYCDSLEFMPAALEILEKPPSPAGRLLGYCLIVFFSLFVGWSFWGEVDIVATAEGKIIPSGHVKQIQPLQTGVIKRIFVEEGQLVKKGEALIEFDQVLTGADRNRLKHEIYFVQANLLREKVLRKMFWVDDQEIDLTRDRAKKLIENYIPDVAGSISLLPSEDDSDLHLEIIYQRWKEYSHQKDILLSQLSSRESESESIKANIKKFKNTLPLVSKRVEALSILNRDGLVAEVRLLELQEEQVSQQQSLVSEMARLQQVKQAIEEAKYNMAVLRNESRKKNLEKIEELGQKYKTTKENLIKADSFYTKKILYAPVNGRINQLTVHTVGGVVQEAQTLMEIVPIKNFLEVEAVLENKDVGFVQNGQIAEIKVHTFPFTKYGVVDAEVLSVTADAIENEQRGLVYKVRFKMVNPQLWVNNAWVDLLPGMAVTAEIKTGKRRLIEFILAPLLRYKEESARER